MISPTIGCTITVAPQTGQPKVSRNVHMAVATSSGQTCFVFLFLEVNLKRINRTRRVRGASRVSGLPASRVCSYSWTRPGPAF